MARTYLQSELADGQTDTFKWPTAADYTLDSDGPLLRPYQRMGSNFASVCSFHHLRDIAEQYPDRLAVSDGVHRLTYSDLFSAVENLSRRIAITIAAGQAVGILLANSVWYPVAMLASMADHRSQRAPTEDQRATHRTRRTRTCLALCARRGRRGGNRNGGERTGGVRPSSALGRREPYS
jgi:non-ribosomal peptide synthetase component F